MALSLLAILPAIYGLKEAAKFGLDSTSALAFTTCIIFAAIFVRRQKKLSEPLLDVRLFANRTFTAALLILLFGWSASVGPCCW